MDNKFMEPWRFWSKVQRRESGCWEWTGAVTSNGYGSCYNYIYPRGEVYKISPHRLSYILAKGEIPGGMQVDHLCRNRVCVNPDHLEAVTAKENIQRGLAATKTHCKHGHEFTEENTRITPGGTRACRACNRANLQAFYKRRGTTNPYGKRRASTPASTDVT